MARVQFDEMIETYLQRQMIELKALGIKPVSRPMALRYIIEQNRHIMMEARRKKKSKDWVSIRLK